MNRYKVIMCCDNVVARSADDAKVRLVVLAPDADFDVELLEENIDGDKQPQEKEAEGKALDVDGDYEFSEHDADYKVESVSEKK